MNEYEKDLAAQQKLVHFAQIVLIFAACVLFAFPPAFFPVYFRPKFMAVVALLYGFCIQLPVFIFRLPPDAGSAAAHEQRFVRGQLQAALSVGFLLGGFGSLGFWNVHIIGIPYDKFVHVAFSMLAMVFGAYAIKAWTHWSLKKTVIIVALIGVALSVSWEFIEFLSDRWLHFGYFGTLFDQDSLGDIYGDFVGIAIGIVVIAWRQRIARKSSARTVVGG